MVAGGSTRGLNKNIQSSLGAFCFNFMPIEVSYRVGRRIGALYNECKWWWSDRHLICFFKRNNNKLQNPS